MQDNEKAKVLLENGSYLKHIVDVLEKNDIHDFMIEEYFSQEIERKLEETDRWLIKENWDGDEIADFLSDGYSRNDIVYADIEELTQELKIEATINIAQYYIDKYFNKDSDLLDNMILYIKECQ